MFSITRLNIQWGTRSATCEKMGHSGAHCPFRSREGPIRSYNGRCVERAIVGQSRALGPGQIYDDFIQILFSATRERS